MLNHIWFDLFGLSILLVDLLWLTQLDQRALEGVSSSDLRKIWSKLLSLLGLVSHSALLFEQHQHTTFRPYIING